MAIEFISWALQQDLPTGAKFVLVALCNRANQDGECWPSQKDIAKQTSMTDRSVRTHIEWLVDSGYLKKETRRRKNGSFTSDKFYIQRKTLPAENSSDGKKQHQPAENISYPETSLNSSLRSELEPSITRASVPNPFAVWWDKYPHKVGKGAAEKSFWKAIKQTDLQTLIDGLERYISTKPPDRAYCNPATWLNQQRWLDKPAEQDGKHETNRTNKPARRYTADDAARDALNELGFGEGAADSGNDEATFCNAGQLRLEARGLENQDAGHGDRPFGVLD